MSSPAVLDFPTLLAGLASSEMTRAQYDRSFAAELQSKAGDQWNLKVTSTPTVHACADYLPNL